jgi:hypothetical protein
MSEQIKRYNVLKHDLIETEIGSCTSGEVFVVIASDHDREIAQRDARIGELERALDLERQHNGAIECRLEEVLGFLKEQTT